MSYVIAPSLPWSIIKGGFKKTPVANTILQKTVANRGNASAGLMPYPSWAYEVDLAAINGNEATSSYYQSLVNWFIGANGRNGLFLFTDPQDNAVVQGNSAMIAFLGSGPSMVGDGTTTVFQLARSIGSGAYDIIQNLNGSVNIYVNGTLQASGVSVSATGVVTFTSAPAAAATLTWSGNFYFLCRFDADSLADLARFAFNGGGALWECPSIKFSSEFV